MASETRRKKNCSRNLREEWSIIITEHKIWLGFSCNRDLCPCYPWDIILTLELGQPQVSLPVQWGWYYMIHRDGFPLSPLNGIPGKGQGAWTFQKGPRASMGDLSSLVSCHHPTQAITPAKPGATFLVETSKLLLANAWQAISYGRLKHTSVSSRPRMGMGNVCWYHWVSKQGRQLGRQEQRQTPWSLRLLPQPAWLPTAQLQDEFSCDVVFSLGDTR